MSSVHLATEDAIELAEILNHGLAYDREASLRRFIGYPRLRSRPAQDRSGPLHLLIGDDPDGELFQSSVTP
jgi:hypothetical protein